MVLGHSFGMTSVSYSILLWAPPCQYSNLSYKWLRCHLTHNSIHNPEQNSEHYAVLFQRYIDICCSETYECSRSFRANKLEGTLSILLSVSGAESFAKTRNLAILAHLQNESRCPRMRSILSFLSSTLRQANLMVDPDVDTHEARFSLDALNLGIGYWQSGNVFSAMANQDFFAGTTTNKAQVVSNLKNVFNLRANYDEFG